MGQVVCQIYIQHNFDQEEFKNLPHKPKNHISLLVYSFICGYCSLTVKEVAGEVETRIGLCHTT